MHKLFVLGRLTSLFLLLLLTLRSPLSLLGESVATIEQPVAQPRASGSGAALVRVVGDLQTDLKNRGVEVQSTLVHDISKSVIGDASDHRGFGRYSLDVSANIDGSKLLGWSGTRAVVHFKKHSLEFGRCFSGVSQGYSNIDAQSQAGLYEVWAEKTLFDDRFRVKAGKIDANTEFAVVATASDFLNSSMGYSPTIMELPTYPDPQLGVLTAAKLTPTSQLMVGSLEVAGGGKIGLAEIAQGWGLRENSLPGRSSLGYWNLREKITRYDGSSTSGTQGFYGTLEQTLWHKALAGKDGQEQRASAFLQFGSGRGTENPFVSHLGGGLVFAAPLRYRSNDSVGVALSQVRFSNQAQPGTSPKTESASEAYYLAKVTGHMSIVTDVQLFNNAGGRDSRFLVATPRLVFTY